MEESRSTCYSDKLSRNIQRAFEEMRTNGEQCDMIIKTGEKEFSVHKIVMAAASDCFLNLSKNDLQSPLVLDHISEVTMADIINFCYTSKMDLSVANASEILGAASKLKMKDLIELCMQYFDEKVNIENYGMVLDAVSRTQYTEIPNRTFKLVLNIFDKVAADRHFLKLGTASMVKVLSSDQLKVKNEESVLKVVRDWFDESPRERASSLNTLLDCVRFALIAPKKLLQLRKDELSFGSHHFLDLVNEAIDFQVSNSDMKSYKGSEKARARLPTHFEPGKWIFIVYVKRRILKYDLFHNTYIDITFQASKNQKSPRELLGGAIIADKLYIVDHDGTMEIYDILNNEWAEPVENKQFSLHSEVEAVFAAGDFVYVILDDIEGSFVRFDSQSKTWQTISYDFYEEELIQDYMVGACSLNGEATVISNWDHQFQPGVNFCSMTHKYTQSKWESGEGYRDDGYKLVAHGNFISFDGKLYSPQARTLVCFDKYLKFHEMPKMTLRRNGANLFEIDGQIVVFGGEPTNTLERYNTKSGEWSTLRLNASFDGVANVATYVRKI